MQNIIARGTAAEGAPAAASIQISTVEWTSKVGASMVYSDTGGIYIPSDVSNLPYGREQHKATHQRLRDGLLKNASVDMGEVDNARRTDDKGRPLVTAIDLIMRSTGQDFSQAQQTYAAMKFSPAKQPDPQLQQRAVDEAERNARELMETEEKEKLNVPQSSDFDKRKMRRKMVKLAKLQRAVEEVERNDAREVIATDEKKRRDAQLEKDKQDSRKMAQIQRAVEEAERNDAELLEANERERLDAQSKKEDDSRKMVEKPDTEKVVETADCVICLEIIRDDDVYCINASCGHILYCSTCARQTLEAPDKHNKCPVCYIETPRGLHCIPSYVALARGIQPRAYGKS